MNLEQMLLSITSHGLGFHLEMPTPDTYEIILVRFEGMNKRTIYTEQTLWGNTPTEAAEKALQWITSNKQELEEQ